MTNYLYYGDNLDVLRESIDTESIDLVYLDPPFNSNRSYNVLFQQRTGDDSQAQIEAFDDTWTWSHEADQQYVELVSGGAPAKVADAVEAMRKLVGDSDVLAYLVMMTPRLIELHRVLKPTGSLYLHCDPTAAHYLKLILDAIFGPTNFRNEIVWRRTGSNSALKRFGPLHQTIFYYVKSPSAPYYPRTTPYTLAYVEDQFRYVDERGRYRPVVLTGPGVRKGDSGKPWRHYNPTTVGRHWQPSSYVYEKYLELRGEDLAQYPLIDRLEKLDEIGLVYWGKDGKGAPNYRFYLEDAPGVYMQDIWAFQPGTEGVLYNDPEGIDADVKWLSSQDAERLGYPTQKPIGLLDRIIRASAQPGDVVLDPFCGCGTTVDAAERVGCRWIGIDITYLAVDLITKRMRDTHGDEVMGNVEVRGIPRDLSGAQALFAHSPFDFERWAVSMVNGQPNQKQVGDKGADGVIRFPLDSSGKTISRALVSVKGGKAPGPTAVRDLIGTVETQRAQMGILITLEDPTRGMIEAAQHAGTYVWPVNGQAYPRVQILTVEQLLSGTRPDAPPSLLPYVEARRQLRGGGEQAELF